MTIKATRDQINSAYGALSRIFEETKLGADLTWRVSRMINELKREVKDYARFETKLYKDAGGVTAPGGGMMMQALTKQGEKETPTEFDARFAAYREKVNKLSADLDTKQDESVEINLKPIPVSLLPKTRKNDKGEQESIEFRATDFANAGPFLVEKEEG